MFWKESTEETKQEYREIQHKVKIKVTKAGQSTYDNMFAR